MERSITHAGDDVRGVAASVFARVGGSDPDHGIAVAGRVRGAEAGGALVVAAKVPGKDVQVVLDGGLVPCKQRPQSALATALVG
jgi:hypothetical protein